jgi:hypothetical protein
MQCTESQFRLNAFICSITFQVIKLFYKYKERVISDVLKVIRGLKGQIKNISHFLSFNSRGIKSLRKFKVL